MGWPGVMLANLPRPWTRQPLFDSRLIMMAKGRTLHGGGDVRSGSDQDRARDPNNAFGFPAARTRGKLRDRFPRDVGADDGEIAVFEFEDVWTTAATRAGRNAGWTKATQEHAEVVTIVNCPVNSFLRSQRTWRSPSFLKQWCQKWPG